jgi:hypothetical protein
LKAWPYSPRSASAAPHGCGTASHFDTRHSGASTDETAITPDNVATLQLLFQTRLAAAADGAPAYWAANGLICRIYEVDPLVCSNCGGLMKIVAFITDRKAIRAILASMRKSAASAFPPDSRPPPTPARPAKMGIFTPRSRCARRHPNSERRAPAWLGSRGNRPDPSRGATAEGSRMPISAILSPFGREKAT